MIFEILFSALLSVTPVHADDAADLCVDEVKNLDCTITYRNNDVLDIQEVKYSINKDTTFFCPAGTPGNDVDDTFAIPNTTYQANIYSSFEFMRLTIFDTAKSTATPLVESASIPPYMLFGMNLYSSAQYNASENEYVLILCTAVE